MPCRKASFSSELVAICNLNVCSNTAYINVKHRLKEKKMLPIDMCHCCCMQSFEDKAICFVCQRSVCYEPCSETCMWCHERVCKRDMLECDFCVASICIDCLSYKDKGWTHPECCSDTVTMCPSCSSKHMATYCASCGSATCMDYAEECECHQTFCTSCVDQYCIYHLGYIFCEECVQK